MKIAETVLLKQAQKILKDFNFDAERTNPRSAVTLLALSRVNRRDAWASAENPALTTRQIMDWIASEFHVEYKANSRETIRRQTLHQFLDASLVETNPDEPGRATNSPRYCYRLTFEALEVLRSFGTSVYPEVLKGYLAENAGLRELYAGVRDLERIPVTLPGGRALSLSPGGQNVLIKRIIEDFCPIFAPGGEVLYIGDADEKLATFEAEALRNLGVSINEHGKMPDLVLFRPEKNWLFLVEAASSHGPVDAKRHRELAALFASSTADIVYVSCFPNRAIMRKYLADIAWETEAWCADDSTHLIHFNGDKFLGPYVEH